MTTKNLTTKTSRQPPNRKKPKWLAWPWKEIFTFGTALLGVLVRLWR